MPEAAKRLGAWLEVANIRGDLAGPLFRPLIVSRGHGTAGLKEMPLTRRAVQVLVKCNAPNTVNSLRMTALTTARECGSDILDLQDNAGHADPRTTLTYIRSRDRLSKSPAHVLR